MDSSRSSTQPSFERSWVARRNSGFRPTASLVIGREIERLLGPRFRYSAEEAALAGLVCRVKVEGIWLYTPIGVVFEDVQDRVRNECLALCRAWVMTAITSTPGKAAQEIDGSHSATMNAIRPLLRLSIRRGELAAMPALTAEHEPYLLVHDPSDADHIAALVAAALALLEETGELSAHDIGAPPRLTTALAWRSNLLAHLEWRLAGSRTEGGLLGGIESSRPFRCGFRLGRDQKWTGACRGTGPGRCALDATGRRPHASDRSIGCEVGRREGGAPVRSSVVGSAFLPDCEPLVTTNGPVMAPELRQAWSLGRSIRVESLRAQEVRAELAH